MTVFMSVSSSDIQVAFFCATLRSQSARMKRRSNCTCEIEQSQALAIWGNEKPWDLMVMTLSRRSKVWASASVITPLGSMESSITICRAPDLADLLIRSVALRIRYCQGREERGLLVKKREGGGYPVG